MTEKPVLQGKNALITGVGRLKGIGAAITADFAAHGANVFITWFRPCDLAMQPHPEADDAAELLQSLVKLGGRASGVNLDLSAAGAAAVLFNLAEKAIGPIDILVNNAAYDHPARLPELTAEDLDTHYSVNLRAPALLCQEFYNRHDGRAGGRIINLTSGQGLGPMPEQPAYAATKGALEALTMSLAPELATKKITINAVDPGPTDTGWMDGATYAAVMQRTPLGRVGQPGDAARLITFLAGEDSAWITGQVIRSRGGF